MLSGRFLWPWLSASCGHLSLGPRPVVAPVASISPAVCAQHVIAAASELLLAPLQQPQPLGLGFGLCSLTPSPPLGYCTRLGSYCSFRCQDPFLILIECGMKLW